MKDISFEKVHKLGNVVVETELYKQFHFPKMLSMYDSNYIEFKRLPLLWEFKEAEEHLQNYHSNHDQMHVKFYFPENLKLNEELENYLHTTGYDLSFMELYGIQPSSFPEIKPHPDIDIFMVSDDNIEAFLDLNNKHNLEFGANFAAQKKKLLKLQFRNPKYIQVFSYYKGIPAGYVHLILSDEAVEIDNLHVEEHFRKKGIGSALQKFVMDTYFDKTIILIADGEDTPKNMYRKQNYQYYGFQYEALKTFD